MKALKTNVGGLDATLRVLAGLALIGLFAAGAIGPWGLVGIVFLLTGLLRYCPAYQLLGIHTCSGKGQRLP